MSAPFAVGFAALLAAGAAAAPAAPAGLVSQPVKATIQTIMSPSAAAWAGAPKFEVRTMPQLIAQPNQPKPSVDKLMVRSLYSVESGWIAFHLEWRDATKDETPRPGQWADVVAIEFPLDAKSPPAPMMGHRPGGRVQIIQWRADWQKDVDKGETTVKDLYPNAVVDTPVEKVYQYADSQAFSAGRAIGNIVSQAKHFYSVQDLMAEGFGTLTPKPVQNALGKGVWEKGTWKVVIARPMETLTDPAAAPLHRGAPAEVGFAVWNGSAGERGARKGWAGWVPLAIK
ncbi:MAG: hypothetical protein FJZ01_22955 [Candidatus Sericytochromatia bacterium]|nr:hypothetical protein [Candidatus Tanganyikabacteria bacterium]